MNAIRYTLFAGVASLALALALPIIEPAEAVSQRGPANLTIRVMWRTRANISLTVKEPNGEVCSSLPAYRRRTTNGGSVSLPMFRLFDTQTTREYTIEGGPRGTYRVGVGVTDYSGEPETSVIVQVWKSGRMIRNEAYLFERSRSTPAKWFLVPVD